MPATIVLATFEPDLIRARWVSIPAGRSVVTLGDLKASGQLDQSGPIVVILDEAVRDRLPKSLSDTPTILIGGGPSADAAEGSAVKARLSYEESRTRLASTLRLVEEIAVSKAALKQASAETHRASAAPFPNGTPTPPASSHPYDSSPTQSLWPFLIEVADSLSTPDSVLSELRRLMRHYFNCSQVHVFIRRPDGFRSVAGPKSELFCPSEDPLVEYLQLAPVIVDGANWPVRSSSILESGVRNRMIALGARLVVPLHDNGWIIGFVVLGVREDGRSYSKSDYERMVAIAGFFRRLHQQSAKWAKAEQEVSLQRLIKEYLPHTLLLRPGEEPSALVPLAIKKLITDAKFSRQVAHLTPSEDQPYRASAGLIAATSEVWCQWADASAETKQSALRQRNERLALLHDIALTLNHELGNALVSLSALRHSPGAESNSPVLLAAIKRDISSLESLNKHLASLPTFGEVIPETIDLGVLAQSIGRKTGISIDATASPVVLCIVPPLVEFAIESILDSIAENRPELGKGGITVKLAGDANEAVFTIQGSHLRLEGIAPAPEPGAPPSHGRISVFIAKEIVRLHGGVIQLRNSSDPTAIVITLKKW